MLYFYNASVFSYISNFFPPITCLNIENTVSGGMRLFFLPLTGENASDEATAQHGLTSSSSPSPGDRPKRSTKPGVCPLLLEERVAGQGACFIFRLVAFVCSPEKKGRELEESEQQPVAAVRTPCSLQEIPKARMAEL